MHRPHRLWPLVSVLSILFLWFDFLTGPYVQFPITFVIPVALAAWYQGVRAGVVCGLVLTLGRFLIVTFWEVPEYTLGIRLLNAGIRLTVFVGLAWMTARLARQTRELANRVDTLEGLLPICCHCKNIRRDDGAWEPVERYVADRTAAEFSHGFCEDCFRAHYPEAHADYAERKTLAAAASR